jgi:phage-related minor tail protein
LANNIKGITIELGGNTGPLTSALKDVNKAAGDAQSGLKEVNKQLKFDPNNVVLSGQKIDLLKEKVAALEEKQKTLKTAVQQAHEAFEKGDLGKDKVQAVEREYEKVNSQLKYTKKDLAAAESASGTFTEKVKGKFSELKDKIKDTFSGENIKTALGAVGVAVGGFLKGSMNEAKDAEKANTDLAQTLKSTKDASGMTVQSLNDLTQAMVNNTTFSDDEIKSGEGMLLTFTNIGKNVFPQATAAVLDFAQKMGTDPKTAALQLGKALNDPATGLSKLTKAGVTFTAAQQKQIKAMEKAGNTAGAQKLMIAELNKEFGGQAAAAAETYDGKQKQIANTMKEIKETIGTALMPMLANLLKTITPLIQSIANFVTKNPQLTAAILALIAVVGTLAGGMTLLNTVMGIFATSQTVALGPILLVVAAVAALAVGAVAVVTHWSQISTFFVNLWNTIKGLFSGIGAWFASVFGGAANGVRSAFASIPAWWSNLWTQVGQFFTNCWNGIISFFTTTIPAWIASVGQWFQQLPYNIGLALGTAIKNIINFGTAAWSWVTTQLPQIINGIIQWFQQLPGRIWTALTQVIAKIGQWITGMGTQVATGVPSLINRIGTWFSQLPGKIWTALLNALQNVKKWCTNLISTAATEIPRFISSAVGFFQQLPGKMLDIGKNVVYGIWNGITSAGSWLWGKITGWCNDFVNGFKKGLGIHSPSKLFADVIGKNIALGIGQGFSDHISSVVQSMTAAIPIIPDSGPQVRTAMAAAYGGYSTSTAIGAGSTGGMATASGSTSDVNVYQYFQGKTPSPAEHARLTRNSLQQVVKKLKG